MAKVPSIPTIAMDSITDRNVYTVLRAIADILNVRNGQTGDYDNAFVTRGELGGLSRAGLGGIGVAGGQQSQGFTFPTIKPSDIARVINDLQAQVMESPLFKALGERVDLIDKPGTGVIAQIADERITRANDVSSLVSDITTLQSSVGANTAALAVEAETRANADGSISGKYAVKIDANGYVSGFGLISTANNATPFSEFIVRADRFAIASPSGPGVPSRIPFIVLTTGQWVNGYWVPAGVYIDAAGIAAASIGEAQINFAAIRRAHIQDAAIGNAQIENAAISYAKIGDAEIDTLKLRGEAVTIPRAASGGGPGISGSGFVMISIYVPGGASAVVVNATATFAMGIGGGSVTLSIRRDGNVLFSQQYTSTAEGALTIPVMIQDAYAGGGTYDLYASALSNANPYTLPTAISCIGCKR